MDNKIGVTPTLEEQADKIYDDLEFSEIKKLVTKGRKTWTHTKKETIALDTLTDQEIQKCNDDPELAKLMILSKIVDSKIKKRIDEIVIAARSNIPYTLTDKKGVRINLDDYALPILLGHCEETRLELEQDVYNSVGYIRPLAKAKTAKGMVVEIEKVLMNSLKSNQNLPDGANTTAG